MADYPITPKLKVPFSITGTKADVVEQDSYEEVEACAIATLRTPIGRCIDEPEWGIADQVFKQVDIVELEEAVAEWEPRARAVMQEEDLEDAAEHFGHAMIDVNLDSQETNRRG